jgi:hypothetical protein
MSTSSTRTGSSRTQAQYKIIEQDSQFRVFDRMGRFHRSFGNKAAAERYIAEHTTRSSMSTKEIDRE